MFGFGKAKKNYKKICQDPKAVFDLLYTDRTKTSEILADHDFCTAWVESPRQREITMIISNEADAGDAPSLKQMVGFLGDVYRDVSSAQIAKEEKFEALIDILEKRISYCNKLTAQGKPEHYYAMISTYNLYKVLGDRSSPGDFTKSRDALNELAGHAQAVIKMGKNHPAFDGDAGFISDAENIIGEVDVIRKLKNAIGDSITMFDKGN